MPLLENRRVRRVYHISISCFLIDMKVISMIFGDFIEPMFIISGASFQFSHFKFCIPKFPFSKFFCVDLWQGRARTSILLCSAML